MGKRAQKKVLSIIESQKRALAQVQAAKDRETASIRRQKLKKARALAQKAASGKPLGGMMFHPTWTVLLVGEGDFSFAVSLLRQGLVTRVIATSLDGQDDVEAKYARAEGFLEELDESPQCDVLHGVDARMLATIPELDEFEHVDAICFNFPHEGRGISDVGVSVRRHQQLLRQFLQTAVDFLSVRGLRFSGRIMVTLKRGEPYNQWGLVKIARQNIDPPLVLEKTLEFHASDYKEYAHRRTVGDHEDGTHLDDATAVTYVFKVRNDAELEVQREVRRKAKIKDHLKGSMSHGQKKKRRRLQGKKATSMPDDDV